MVGMAGSTNTFHLFLVAVVATSLKTLLCRATRDACVFGHTCRMCSRDSTLPHASQVMLASTHLHAALRGVYIKFPLKLMASI